MIGGQRELHDRRLIATRTRGQCAGLDDLEGLVWQKQIERTELDDYKERYTVISNKMVAGKPQIHVLSDDDPGDGFSAVAPSLEDVFFTKINESNSVTA